MSKIPARCNRRACQARRNIDVKYLNAARDQMPRCQACGQGRMYVDRYRLNKLDYRDKPVCTDPHCPTALRLALANNGRVFPHCPTAYDCSGHDDYVLARRIADSPHCPHPRETAPLEPDF